MRRKTKPRPAGTTKKSTASDKSTEVTISFLMDNALLRRADRLARARKITRARLIAEGLASVIAQAAKARVPAKVRRKAA